MAHQRAGWLPRPGPLRAEEKAGRLSPKPSSKSDKEVFRETEGQRRVSPLGELKEGPGVFLLS